MKNKKIGMSCDEARELMFGYIEGELDQREASRLAAHLIDCPECREELESCRKLLDTLAKTEYPVPDRLHSSVMALVGSTPQEKPSPMKRIFGGTGRLAAGIGTIAAACAVITLVIVGRGYFLPHTDLASDERDLAAGAELMPGGDPETVGALFFASPMTSDENEMTPNELPAESSISVTPSANDYSDTANQKKADVTEITVDGGEDRIILADRSLSIAVDDFVNAGNAVVVISGEFPGESDYGTEIKVAGLEDLNFREVEDDAENALLGIENLAVTNSVNSKVYIPDGGYDSLIIVYDDTIDLSALPEGNT